MWKFKNTISIQILFPLLKTNEIYLMNFEKQMTFFFENFQKKCTMCLPKTINATKCFFFQKSKCQMQLNAPQKVRNMNTCKNKTQKFRSHNHKLLKLCKVGQIPLGLDYKFKKNEVDQENWR